MRKVRIHRKAAINAGTQAWVPLIKLSQPLFMEGSVFRKAKMTFQLGLFGSLSFVVERDEPETN